MVTATQQKPQSAAPPKFTLDKLVRGKQQQPIRVLLYGPEGIGKSTFGSNAPSPIFLGAEDGTGHLDTVRFPAPEKFEDVQEAVNFLLTSDHGFKTLVIDTADWLEPLLWEFICRRDGNKSIEDYGFGKGYVAALDVWRSFLQRLDALRAAKKMHVIVLAHSVVRTFKNPEGDDFDRYQLKLHEKAGGLVKEWVDAVLFCNYETFASKDTKTKRVKGVSTGARLVYTVRTAAYDAKNRYGLPESMPLSWDEFEKAANAHAPADPKALLEEISRKAPGLNEADRKAAEAAVARANGDAVKLAQLNDWMNGKIALSGANEAPQQ